MAFRYINPGYAELLDVKGGKTVAGEQYSKTGVAFWQPTENKGIELSEVPGELYGRFDLYLKNRTGNPSPDVCMYIGYKNGIGLSGSGTPWRFDGRVRNATQIYLTNTSDILCPDAINTVWFHIKPGNNGNGVLQIIANGHEIGHEQSLHLWYADDSEAKIVTVYSKNDSALISNLILSDEEISPKEQVVMLPVKETETDMQGIGDGSYEASATNQEILQSVDVSPITEQYGAESRVTGIALVANPAYRTAGGLSALTAIEKSGGRITEYGRYVTKEEPASAIADTRSVAMRITDFEGRQFGWRAGT